MGLLDDAIREHLEFKRLRGADPSEVAREKEEALGAVHRGQDFGPSSPPDPHTEAPPEENEGTWHETDSVTVETSTDSSGLTPTGQETAELDMRTILAAENAKSQDSAGDSLEWETPSRSSGEARAEVQEDDELTRTLPSEEEVEDVLEETPDFLRETPDQERLWFEQQPPRDFDFDK